MNKHVLNIDLSSVPLKREDLIEQLKNERRAPLSDMSCEAYGVLFANWDEKVDGPWPPPMCDVVVGVFNDPEPR